MGYNSLTSSDSLVTAIGKIDGNIGEAVTGVSGNILATNSVNQNLDSIDMHIGNMGDKDPETGIYSNLIGNGLATYDEQGEKLTEGATDIVSALQNLDKTLGMIHGLFDGEDVHDPDSKTHEHSNLAQGTTLEQHLVSLDNSIGDRTLESANTAINEAMSTSSVASAIKVAGDMLGDTDFSDTRYAKSARDTSSAIKALDDNIYRLDNDVKDLRHDFRSGMASLAAMSALVPNSYHSGKTSISVGTGAYV